MTKRNVPLIPGIVFDAGISDPKERIQTWIDGYIESQEEETTHVRRYYFVCEFIICAAHGLGGARFNVL